MVNFNNKLEIFERFEIDKNLPKYKDGVPTELRSSFNGVNGITFANNGDPVNINDSFITFGSATTMGTNTIYVGNGMYNEKPKREWKFLKWFKQKKEGIKIRNAEKVKNMTIIQFFSSLATSLNDLKTLTDIAVHYETAIGNATKAGQIALADQLKLRLNSAKSEAQLVAYGLNKYLTEEQVVAFYNTAQKDKHLKLTWVKNFVKPIPSKILDLKHKLDETFVFDNYVILHYDPNNDATNLTDKERKELEKDPILFGVIDKSRRLYYIGDWIDEYCNLTLDVVMETLGDVVSEINNETVKTFIDRGFTQDVRIRKHTPVEKSISPEPTQIVEESSQSMIERMVEALKPERKPVVEESKVIIKKPVMIKENQSREKIKKKKK